MAGQRERDKSGLKNMWSVTERKIKKIKKRLIQRQKTDRWGL